MTGDLAAVEVYIGTGVTGTIGSVAVFKDGGGAPVRYANPASWRTAVTCGYDPAGNLFVSGSKEKRNDYAALAELEHGDRKLRGLYLSGDGAGVGAFRASSPKQVQWDGSYVSVAAVRNDSNSIYRFAIDSRTATLANVTSLDAGFIIEHTWIDGNTVVAVGYSKAAWFFPYPAGGKPMKKFDVPGAGNGVTISTTRKGPRSLRM